MEGRARRQRRRQIVDHHTPTAGEPLRRAMPHGLAMSKKRNRANPASNVTHTGTTATNAGQPKNTTESPRTRRAPRRRDLAGANGSRLRRKSPPPRRPPARSATPSTSRSGPRSRTKITDPHQRAPRARCRQTPPHRAEGGQIHHECRGPAARPRRLGQPHGLFEQHVPVPPKISIPRRDREHRRQNVEPDSDDPHALNPILAFAGKDARMALLQHPRSDQPADRV